MAIVQAAEVSSSAQIQSIDAKEDSRVLVVDWFLRLSPRETGAEAEERGREAGEQQQGLNRQ